MLIARPPIRPSPGSLRGPLLGLGSIPQVVEGREIEVADGDATLGDHPLDAPEPAPELLVRGPERRLGLDPELPSDVHDDEQQVAELLVAVAVVARRAPAPPSSSATLSRTPSTSGQS